MTNRNPIAKADTYTTRPNQTLNVAAPGLLGNDSDPDGDALNVSVLNVTGLKGTITPYADGHFNFTPTTNFAGTTSFTYTISDGVGGRSTATATINVGTACRWPATTTTRCTPAGRSTSARRGCWPTTAMPTVTP
ncbi:MAG: cadherin-like domain-containing protein [Candidatus Accumulibacter sp.]|nr:cadherin-like domain-containing protein [Candidatus Accumulibacter propinquus]